MMATPNASPHGPPISTPAPSRITTVRFSWRTILACIIVAVLAILLSFWLTRNTNEPTFFHSEKVTETHPVNASQENVINTAATTTSTCACEEELPNGTLASSMGLVGTISDCCCSFIDLETANAKIIYPLLQDIVATPFFAHFQIDLLSECPLWDDQPLCMLRDCSVCAVTEPPIWAVDNDWTPDADCDDSYEYYNVEDRVVTTVDWHVKEDWSLAPPQSFLDDGIATTASISEDGTTTTVKSNVDDRAVVVDLRLNPERYTGYDGASAAKVWSAIHLDNCFQQEEVRQEDQPYCSLPAEQRVYNRVISGMHSSISLHIAHSYCLEMDPDRMGECAQWGWNPDIAKERVLSHRDRTENLFVAFALLLRAVQKAGSAISAAVPHDDPFYADSLMEWTDHLWPELARLAHSCPTAFDEATLLSGNDSRKELLRRFRYLQQIMQCVGCDRCKLWGTLQTLGVGTALRILLDGDGEAVTLTRQEAVALVHTLERFSSALVFANELAAKVG